MTRDAIFDRLIASDRTCGRQKKRSKRMLACCLATYPGVKAMECETDGSVWAAAAVDEYKSQHQNPKKLGRTTDGDYGFSVTLLLALAEIIIKALVWWFNNRELTTEDLTRLHLQA